MGKVICLLFPVFLFSQNIDLYLSLLHEGQAEGVREQLPELISKYPNDPGVLYLQALLETDGMKSLELYSSLIDKYPESAYAPDAAVKIGEYFYARGLYSQAGRQLSQIPRRYPRYPDVQRVIDLMVNSFQAIGAEDSIRYYVGVYQSMFPSLNVEGKGTSNSDISSDAMSLKPQRLEPKSYVVQIGAFGKNGNARRLKLQVSQIGFDVEIVPVKTNGRMLHAVRIVRFKSQKEAEKVGTEVKKKLGIDYRVLYRPKDQKK